MQARLRQLGSIICFFVMFLYLTASLCFNTFAASTGTMTLVCRSEDVVLTGMQWQIYRVGYRVNDELILEGEFADYPVTLGDLSAEDVAAAAKTLENYAVIDKISPVAIGETDANGELRFDNLEMGMYLVSGKELQIGDTIYVPSAILIEVTQREVDVDAYPKFMRRTISSRLQSYTVKKIWENDTDFPEDRAVSISVEIYCGEELYDTVVLDEENEWSYTWMAETGESWRVKEIDIPDKYTVSYRSNETQFAIINTHEDLTPDVTTNVTSTSDNTTTTTVVTTKTKDETNTKPGSDTKLPQTGQLWWPVPLMAFGGIIFVGVGCRLNSGNKKDDN